jgi:beta-glucosidase
MPPAAGRFPEGFLWGASTSAFQIEGALGEEGRGPSVWDAWMRQPGRIADGSTAAVACDHYHRWPEDIELLARLGAGTYRFSIAWPRVMPEGRGPPNAKGLDFYDRLVDGLLAAGIEPWPCLYHFDLPLALEEAGGWRSRDTALRLGDYAAVVGRRLGDRVKRFATINEPNIVLCSGYVLGLHPPGRRPVIDWLRAMHHLALGHGTAAAALRASAPGAEIGPILSLGPVTPASRSIRDRIAGSLVDLVWRRALLEPLLLGRYPRRLRPLLAPFVRQGDMAAIGAGCDYLGLNHYSRVRVGAGGGGPLSVQAAPPPDGRDVTASGWEIDPEAFQEQLLELKDRYGNPQVYVTENGAAFSDRPDQRGRVDDPRRVAFFEGYLGALAAAVARGCAVRGYLVWSLLDNFEWSEGFTRRFGIVHVDRETLARTPKASFDFLEKVFRSNALPP